MSIEAKIATLKTVAALDAELLALETELRARDAETKKLEGERSELAGRRNFLETSIAEMERTRAQLSAELRQMTSQLERARDKLARCRNEREANAATRELEELRRIQRERDNEIVKLGGLADQARADLEALGGAPVAPTEAATPENETRALIAEKRAAREVALEGFDKALLRRYDAVRQKRGTGLAAVVNGNCTACHIALSPMVYQQMMHRKELFTCPSCLRILYLAPAKTAEPASDAADAGSEEASEG